MLYFKFNFHIHRSGSKGTGFIGCLPHHASHYMLTCHHVLRGGRLEKEVIRDSDFTFNHKEKDAVTYKGHQLFDVDNLTYIVY